MADKPTQVLGECPLPTFCSSETSARQTASPRLVCSPRECGVCRSGPGRASARGPDSRQAAMGEFTATTLSLSCVLGRNLGVECRWGDQGKGEQSSEGGIETHNPAPRGSEGHRTPRRVGSAAGNARQSLTPDPPHQHQHPPAYSLGPGLATTPRARAGALGGMVGTEEPTCHGPRAACAPWEGAGGAEFCIINENRFSKGNVFCLYWAPVPS